MGTPTSVISCPLTRKMPQYSPALAHGARIKYASRTTNPLRNRLTAASPISICPKSRCAQQRTRTPHIHTPRAQPQLHHLAPASLEVAVKAHEASEAEDVEVVLLLELGAPVPR